MDRYTTELVRLVGLENKPELPEPKPEVVYFVNQLLDSYAQEAMVLNLGSTDTMPNSPRQWLDEEFAFMKQGWQGNQYRQDPSGVDEGFKHFVLEKVAETHKTLRDKWLPFAHRPEYISHPYVPERAKLDAHSVADDLKAPETRTSLDNVSKYRLLAQLMLKRQHAEDVLAALDLARDDEFKYYATGLQSVLNLGRQVDDWHTYYQQPFFNRPGHKITVPGGKLDSDMVHCWNAYRELSLYFDEAHYDEFNMLVSTLATFGQKPE